jgi:NADH-quinone oxidoreductase subunit A
MIVWILASHFLFAVIVVGGLLALSSVLGERHRDRDTAARYESGLAPAQAAGGRVSVQFHQVAIAFLIFDLEVVFFVAWALVAPELGWPALLGMLGFTVVLLVGLLYEWRSGVLDWGRAGPEFARAFARARTEEGPSP